MQAGESQLAYSLLSPATEAALSTSGQKRSMMSLLAPRRRLSLSLLLPVLVGNNIKVNAVGSRPSCPIVFAQRHLAMTIPFCPYPSTLSPSPSPPSASFPSSYSSSSSLFVLFTLSAPLKHLHRSCLLCSLHSTFRSDKS